MKRITILVCITIVTIAAIIISGNIVNAAVEVKGYRIIKSDCENIISSSGRLQYLKEVKISSQKYCMTDHIFVSDGENVNKGDPLLTVYEIDNINDIIKNFPDAQKYIELVTGGEIGDDIADEVRKYAVRTTINAPCDGVVNELAYTKNCFVNKNGVILKISDAKEVCIKTNVSETNIEKIHEGQAVKIKFPAQNTKRFSGKVKSIAKQAKQSGTLTGKDTVVEVVIIPDGKIDGLRIGYTAECEIVTAVDKDVLTVPYEYIMSDSTGEYVYVSRFHRAKKQYIKTGREYPDGAEILSGVKENDIALLSGTSLSEGQIVSAEVS